MKFHSVILTLDYIYLKLKTLTNNYTMRNLLFRDKKQIFTQKVTLN